MAVSPLVEYILRVRDEATPTLDRVQRRFQQMGMTLDREKDRLYITPKYYIKDFTKATEKDIQIGIYRSNKTIDVAKAQQKLNESVRMASDNLRNYTRNVSASLPVTGAFQQQAIRIGHSIDNITRASQGATVRMGPWALAFRQVAGAAMAVRTNMLFLMLNFLFLEMGANRVTRAQRRLNEMIEKYGEDSEEARAAAEDLRSVQLQQQHTMILLISTIATTLATMPSFINQLRYTGIQFMTVNQAIAMQNQRLVENALAWRMVGTSANLAGIQIRGAMPPDRGLRFAVPPGGGGLVGGAMRGIRALPARLAPLGRLAAMLGRYGGWIGMAASVIMAFGLWAYMEQLQRQIPSAQVEPGRFRRVERTGLARLHEGEVISRGLMAPLTVNINQPVIREDIVGDRLTEFSVEIVEKIRQRLRAL